MFTITINCQQDGKLLAECLEQEQSSWKRGGWSYKKKGEGLDITVTAQDVTALKAMTNSVVQLLTVFEKMKQVVENGKTS
jgi:tRNA threonylcarbamoyladenosine modification (KEOPS) complex  Pcc1 subunit